MAYGTYDRDVHQFINETSALPDIHALEVTAGDKSLAFDVVEPIVVTRIGVMATVAYDYDTQTAEGQVAVDRRVAYGSDAGRVELGVIKQADGTPAGTVLYKDINPVNCDVGDQLIAEVKVAATGGAGIAGDFKVFFCYHHRAETDANQAEQTASA